ncbi:MAG: D-alanyl-D-alanine endopeptidase [Zoogloeaceae bacterium]|jgi:D-alanyl-D-alanine endopeptidase (penicillin-binding protein 7)|nr:D-alanyl-D-alanine endopeptidase [Zoogloeaceae bacterium]
MKKTFLAFVIALMTILHAVPDDVRAKPQSGAKKTTVGKKQASKKQGNGKTARKTGKNKFQARKAGNPRLVARPPRARGVIAIEEDAFWDGDPRTLGSAAVLVMDQTSGKILLEKNPDMISPIASISKLMTAMVVLDAGQDMEEIISLGEEDVDYRKGTHSRLQIGTSMTRDTALLLALMSSENRAANALGRHYPGGLPAFVATMNRKARSLGLKYTHFVEPTGLSSDNVSTPRELARLAVVAHRYPKIRAYSTMAQAHLDTGGAMLVFNNTNTLVKNPNWQIGLSKTGYISEAGRCLVMQAWVSGRPVVMVLLDSSGKMTRVGDAVRIKRWMEDARLPRPTGV